ncbi:MAG: DUF362 domain-containing protein [Ignavibacteriales bacterium]|nr:DUF362 domain-containing protein [Ignavibacteriales bacterium]
MKKHNGSKITEENCSRRKFIGAVGATAAGLLLAPSLNSTKLFGRGLKGKSSYVTQVAVTQATSYDRTLIKQKVQHLFDSIGGIGDIVSAGKKVGIKVNLTGGNTDTDHMCTHPEVLRAVTELIIAEGVSKSDIYVVEALWADWPSNYKTILLDLGVNTVDLNKPAPSASFITRSVGDKYINFASFTQNKILSDIDVYVSIPKLKQHYEAGFTGSLKNQIGSTPKQLYTLSDNTSYRSALHQKDNAHPAIHTYLPETICDLNLARPVHLAVIDGVMNAHGSEGDWNPVWIETEDNILFAGKDPVATDSIAAHFMGLDPEAAQLKLPEPVGTDRGYCDNHLYLLHERGMGTNLLSEIEVVGDGAHLVSVPSQNVSANPESYQLCQNFPNPFNPSTSIKYYVPHSGQVTIHIYNIMGQRIETLVDTNISAGTHELHWVPQNLASGIYFCEMHAGNFSSTKKLIYQK